MKKEYNELIENQLFFGGARDVEDAITNEGIDLVVDLRQEETKEVGYTRIHTPISDEPNELKLSIRNAVDKVLNAYHDGKKVYFHCGSGSGKAGTVASAVLLELNKVKTIDEAMQKTKEIRHQVVIQPSRQKALQEMFNESKE
ncbi:protein-tyrosine phosphatase family protein [Rummeliibacillus sp. BSL5]